MRSCTTWFALSASNACVRSARSSSYIPIIRLALRVDYRPAERCSQRARCRVVFRVSQSTYRQGNFSTFSHLLGKDSQEVENAGMALGAVAKRLDNRRQHIVPTLHLDSQNGQTHTQLDSDRFGAGGVVLQQE